MRHIRRSPETALSERTRRFLTTWTTLVAGVAQNNNKALRAFWGGKRTTKSINEVIEKLRAMNGDREHCMCCEYNEGSTLEHFEPIATDKAKMFKWDNLLLACSACNSSKNAAFERLPDGRSLVFDPTVDRPEEHLRCGTNGVWETVDGSLEVARAAATLSKDRGYDLNRGFLRQGRKQCWRIIELLLIEWSRLRAAGTHQRADEIRAELLAGAFPSVMLQIIRLADHPDGASLVYDPACLEVIRNHPEIRSWLTPVVVAPDVVQQTP